MTGPTTYNFITVAFGFLMDINFSKRLDFTHSLALFNELNITAVAFIILLAMVLLLITAHLWYQLKISKNKISGLTNDVASKQQFIELIAHELANPFNVIKGYADLLMANYDQCTPSEKLAYIKVIHKNITYNKELLESLIDWTKSHQSIHSLERQHFNVSNLVDHLILPHKLQANLKKVKIKNTIAESLCITADKKVLQTILSNLVSNAIKYSHKGGVVTIASALKGNTLELIVIDQGIGFSFTKEYRSVHKIAQTNQPVIISAHRLKNIKIKGYGIGLKLCNTLAQLHDGALKFKSQKNKGTAAILQIPLPH